MMIPRTLGHHGLRRPLSTGLSLRAHNSHNSPILSHHLRGAPSNNAPPLSLGFPAPRGLIPISYRRSHTLNSPSSSSSTPSSSPSSPPPPYAPPTTGILSHLPPSLVPYAELLRIDKPTGTYYLFFPCLFSTLLAAPLTTPLTPPLTVLGTSLLFLSGAFIMRGAGCAINDLWDRNCKSASKQAIHQFYFSSFFQRRVYFILHAPLSSW